MNQNIAKYGTLVSWGCATLCQFGLNTAILTILGVDRYVTAVLLLLSNWLICSSDKHCGVCVDRQNDK